MPVVVVESPAKAKTIENFLGKDYTVLASFGHVRDLAEKEGSVNPDHNFAMKWEVPARARRHIKAIADALQKDKALILATDPDREGEAISWHLEEALRARKAIREDTTVDRIAFNSVTRRSLTEAMENPRKVDRDLVEAYLARRALDYLVGYTLSPVLWRKLPGARSAGRVQSVCLRLIVEREMEVEAFRIQEYWTVKAVLATPRGEEFEARLTVLDGNKLDRLGIPDEDRANEAVQAILSSDLSVKSVEAKPVMRSPPAPFITSTLQQEASRKLGFGAKATMQAAQKLYEAGHITYMRTDGVDMAPEAIMAVRDAIKERYGAKYLPKGPRRHKSKAKNAQEAHECIRPTRMSAHPTSLPIQDTGQLDLYDLIWMRALASQMESARFERTTVDIASADGLTELRATGQVQTFDGFMRVYEEGRDDVVDDNERILPRINNTEPVQLDQVLPEQHFTKPPPRYTEATLVKKMEKIGIGRPSTYASVVSTIQDRGYVRKEKDRLYPEEKGQLVTAFLMNYFRRYLSYDFTAKLEEELDDITSGTRDWKDVLARFWEEFSASVGETSELRFADVLEKINEILAPHLFPPTEDGRDPRICPHCGTGRLSARTARAGGAFIGCSNYPECRYSRAFGPPGQEPESNFPPEGRKLGEDGEDAIWVHKGRFGPYVQRGEASADGEKPQRRTVPEAWDPAAITLEEALRLLELPRLVGQHPEDGVSIWANLGRFGPFLKHADSTSSKGGTTADLESIEEVWSVGMNRAVELIAAKVASRGNRRRNATVLKELGEHPERGGPVTVLDGKYGPYVNWNRVNATVPKDADPASIDMATATRLIEEREAKGGKTRRRRKVS
ncbi:MAG: type I DNA topoisomerase [Boseongicola sp. SB0667_bin_21]|nr:type I DNA topoisomerase [Boseongicola sp. SB0667_bin_21]